MKRNLILAALALIISSSYAANTDSISAKEVESKICQLETQIEKAQKEINSLSYQVSELSKNGKITASNLDSLSEKSENLSVSIDQTKNEFSDSIENIGKNISKTDSSVEATKESIKNRTVVGILAFVIALIAAVAVYLILKGKISSSSSVMEKIKETQEKIQEESLKLDNKMIELMDKQLSVGNENASNTSAEPDHSLALKVADEIVRIELNLSKMDPSVKGHKQLSKAVERIKNNFLAQGYEMVDMLGKTYNEGTKAVVTFIDDESLNLGDRIVTGITKPQINYNGQMIQAAQIIVTQNIN